MTPTETDLDLLETFLDEGLDVQDVESLRARLAADPDLAAALKQLKGDRALRCSVFTALEPDDAALDAFTTRLLRTVKTPPAPRRTWLQPLRYTAAAAALIAVGFFGRGLLDLRGVSGGSSLGTSGHIVDLRNNKATPRLQEITVYQVTLRDDAGKVVAVQRFDSLDKAHEFAADLSRWQSRNQRLASNQFVVTTDRF
jgi:anti-sigma factor RsiW